MAILKMALNNVRRKYSFKYSACFLCVMAVLIGQESLAETGVTIQQLEQKEEKDNVLDMINQARNILTRMDRKWKLDCAKAIGYEPFCSCIGKEIPSAFSFSDYIAITVRSKEENNYQNLDDEKKRAYNLVFKVRDKCVNEINEKP